MDYFIRENNTHFNLAPTIIYKNRFKIRNRKTQMKIRFTKNPSNLYKIEHPLKAQQRGREKKKQFRSGLLYSGWQQHYCRNVMMPAAGILMMTITIKYEILL